MTTRQSTHGNPNRRRKTAFAALETRIAEGLYWWTSRDYTDEDAHTNLERSRAEVETLKSRIKK